jgi:DNA-binding transcriptional LysR family regulator
MRYDLQTLKAFLAIADEGSIAGAAAREHTVASGISKRVAEMEAQCGTSLLYRHRRGVSLTPAGVELVAYARRVIGELSRMDSALSDYASGVRGQVRLLANTSAIVQFLPGDFASFLKLHPTVKIDLEERTSEQTQKMMLDGLADIGIMVASRPVEGLIARPYHSDRLVVMMPPGHPLSRRKQVRFADTLAFDHVGLPRGSSLCERLLEEAKKLDMPLKLRIQATSFEGLVLMASAGLGIGVLPEGSLIPFLETKRVITRPLVETWATRQLVVVTREGQPLTRVAKLLAEHLSAR